MLQAAVVSSPKVPVMKEVAEGDTVFYKPKRCKAKVSFIEDDYVEVTLSNGATMDGSLKDIEVPKMVDEDEIGNHDPVVCASRLAYLEKHKPEMIVGGQLFHNLGAILTRALGGNAAAWHVLSPFQKLNFIGMAEGSPFIATCSDANWNSFVGLNFMKV